ncbi:MAG: ThuA domain-containing protein [Planctomycetota bacterium]
MQSTWIAQVSCLLAAGSALQDPPPAAATTAAVDARWVVYEGAAGPGRGKHVVLVAGDEEYRSEEALPQLGRILAQHHGFRSTVLFAQDPKTGLIDPEEREHIPGLEALDSADLLVLFTRFRRLPDEDMRHIVDYVESGKPVLGIRTATHAFAYDKDSKSPYARWSWDSTEWPGGFGRQVLGETWVSHYGQHGSESTRGVIRESAREHPILRGVEDVWGTTDVYGIRELPKDAVVLLEGSVLSGMEPASKPVEDGRNAPRMPITWVRERELEGGRKQRVIGTTIGASIDLRSHDLRRLLVNACYWGMGLEDKIGPASRADVVGKFEPTTFGFGTHVRGVRPADLAWSVKMPEEEAGEPRQPR